MSDFALMHQLYFHFMVCRGRRQKPSNCSDKRLRSLRNASSRCQMQLQKLELQQRRLLTGRRRREAGRQVRHSVAIRGQGASALALTCQKGFLFQDPFNPACTAASSIAKGSNAQISVHLQPGTLSSESSRGC